MQLWPPLLGAELRPLSLAPGSSTPGASPALTAATSPDPTAKPTAALALTAATLTDPTATASARAAGAVAASP